MCRPAKVLFTALLSVISNVGMAESPYLRDTMVQLGQDMHRISDGILKEDWALVAGTAREIAAYPWPPMGERMVIAGELGLEAADFRSRDRQVHKQAEELAAVANAGEPEAVLSSYSRLLEGCLGCHTRYRERVRGITGARHD